MTEGSRLRETVILFSESEASLGRHAKKYPEEQRVRESFSPDPLPPGEGGGMGAAPP